MYFDFYNCVKAPRHLSFHKMQYKNQASYFKTMASDETHKENRTTWSVKLGLFRMHKGHQWNKSPEE